MKRRRTSRLKIREWSLALLGVSVLTMAVIVPQSASAVAIKPQSILQDNTIKLGDVFTGLESNSDKVLGVAPLPGQDMVLNANTLLRIAVALDLPWRPASAADQVVLKRPASVIERSAIEDAVKNALSAQDLPGTYSILFAAAPQKVILPQSEAASVEVVSMNVDTQAKRFDAVMAAPSKANPIEQFNVSGTLQRMVEIPVLRETLQNGDVISNSDLEFIEIREEKITPGMVLKAEDMIGKTPRRLINAGKTIKDNDLTAPQMIARGELVTMVFSYNGLTLTAQGKAMQNGAQGETIRVVNAASSKTIQALVTGDKEVTVQSF